MKWLWFVPRLLLFLVFVAVWIFIGLIPVTWIHLLAERQRRREYIRLWSNMWKWTIGEQTSDDEKPSGLLLLALSALAALAFIITVRILL